MSIRQSIVNPATITARPHDISCTQQTQPLTHHVLRRSRDQRQIADAQLAAFQQRMQNRQSRRVPQQPKQLRGLDLRLTARHTIPDRINRLVLHITMHWTDIQIDHVPLLRKIHCFTIYVHLC